VHHQAVARRIDVAPALVVALEVQADGVMMPNRPCSGVNATETCHPREARRLAALQALSYCDGRP
jgi:hypothetical protein